jgi:hypothetical protein
MTSLSRHQSVGEGLRAGLVAGLVSSAPSTVYSVAAGRDPLEATLAAGSMILPREHRRGRLIAAAIPVHFFLSAIWGVVLAAVLPRKRSLVFGTAAGLAIGTFDLILVGRLFPRIKALPAAPQFADHIAYGAAVTTLLQRSQR